MDEVMTVAFRARAGDAFVVPTAADVFDVRGDLRVLRCTGGDAA